MCPILTLHSIIILGAELCAEKSWPPPGVKNSCRLQFPTPELNVQKTVGPHPGSRLFIRPDLGKAFDI